ncbi:MAG: hypothetical protein K2I96_12150 [Lachnospiraceae bacterium]|nr:hypothetical protein [Lachnospiraceae bacterium]
MTNFEHMKKRVLDAVSMLDEAELRQLISDTCMDEGDAEGIFSCGLCEEVYGDCDVVPGCNSCMKKYLDWCAKEYGHEPGSAREDRESILMRLKLLLKATRVGSGVKDLVLSEDGNKVIIQFAQGGRVVNVECDSGYAMIMDVMKAL